MTKFALISALALFVALSTAAPRKRHNHIKIPRECQNSKFCSIRPDGYDEIERRVNRHLSPYMIGNSQERYGPIPTTERIETNDDNCPSIRSRQSYYTIREENATTVQIIVQTSNFRQTLEVVECEREKIEQRPSDRQCFENLGLHSFSMRATCEETTATRSLLVYDPLKDQVMEKNYTISVCCSCRVTHK